MSNEEGRGGGEGVEAVEVPLSGDTRWPPPTRPPPALLIFRHLLYSLCSSCMSALGRPCRLLVDRSYSLPVARRFSRPDTAHRSSRVPLSCLSSVLAGGALGVAPTPPNTTPGTARLPHSRLAGPRASFRGMVTMAPNGHNKPVDVLVIGLGAVGSAYSYLLEKVSSSTLFRACRTDQMKAGKARVTAVARSNYDLLADGKVTLVADGHDANIKGWKPYRGE